MERHPKGGRKRVEQIVDDRLERRPISRAIAMDLGDQYIVDDCCNDFAFGAAIELLGDVQLDLLESH